MKRNKVDQIYEAVRKIDSAYELWASKHGLTLYEMQIYYEMLKLDEAYITQKDLCLKLDAPKTSINSIIKKQLKSERIIMEVNPENKREKIISLTEKGKNFAEELIRPLFKLEDDVAVQIDSSEMDTAIRVQMQLADMLLGGIEHE